MAEITPEEEPVQPVGHFKNSFSSVRVWMALCLTWAAVIAWSHQREMDPDGFSYLQMANRAAGGEISALINGYWSPGYPAMLAVLLALFRPAPEKAFAVAHLLNFLIFAGATCALVYFLRSWSKIVDENGGLLVPCGFILFLKFGIDWMGVHSCTPDLAVGAVVLLAVAIVSRLASGEYHWPIFPMLGVVLALGYYIKAVVFVLAVLLFILLLLLPPSIRVSRLAILSTVATFFVASVPLLALQSRVAGHLTFGETGRLNYAWYVNRVAAVQREAMDSSIHLLNPPRRISENPFTLEFAAPVLATYPLWYDPYYWSKGVQAHFDLRQQIAVLNVTLIEYADMGINLAVLIAASVVVIANGSGGTWLLGRRTAWLVLWPISCMALYGLVHIEARFLGGFMIVFWTGVLSVGLRRTRIVSRGAILAVLGIGLLLPTAFHFMLAASRIANRISHPGPTGEMVTARSLIAAGLHQGDRIAVVGATFEPYYAWFAKVNVVAQVPDQDDLWRASTTDFQTWLSAVRRTGAKALVAMDRPAYATQVAWQDLPVTAERNSTIGGSEPHRFSIYIVN